MNKSTVRSVSIIAALAVAIAGCGGGGSSSTPSPTEGLWVPNFESSNVVEFSAQERARSGAPKPARTNSSSSLGDPVGVTFDESKNLWVTNCEDPVTEYGSITEFSRDQLDQLGANPAPEPVVTMSDDGNGDIFDCPYGADFDPSGNLWTVNRYLRDLIEFTPAQLVEGGVQYPNTEITSIDFSTPLGSNFDTNGTIWMTDFAQNEIYGFTAATLSAASGSIALLTPDIINSSVSLNGPSAIDFDAAGDQWVSNCLGATLTEFAPLPASGSPVPLVELSSTTVTTPSGSAPSLACPEGLAFDHNGNLWVSNGFSDNSGSLAEFSRAQLAAGGSPMPVVFLDSNPDGTNISQPALLSFDR
jgi:DNA-binding beta-propeller fold protein YncE